MSRLKGPLAIVTAFFLLVSCEREIRPTEALRKLTHLERIKTLGVLRVVTRIAPTTYYKGPEGYTGLEYDLVQLFAARLGVTAKFVIPESFDQILYQLFEGKADIAAAGLTVTEKRSRRLRFTPAYGEVTEQVVYRAGKPAPKTPQDLADGVLEVVKGTNHVDTLRRLKERIPDLEWRINEEFDSDTLLYLVNEGIIDYTVSNSNLMKLTRRFFPKLNVAFDISEPCPLAWALPQSEDDSLYREAVKFFEEIKRDKTLDRLLEKHYGHAGSLNYADNITFRRRVKSRLPEFRRHFERAGEQHGLDWRLLAVIGYQESHWSTRAISPTGVRGLMMLTQQTAVQLGVGDREDPVQSIDGGARYFIRSKRKIPKRIPEPDRTWLGLAAYNIGYGHLEDARVLTQKLGGDPDKWMDVKERLPLLGLKEWHSQTKHGFARGEEPVRFVENVRGYYDLLVWLTDGNLLAKKPMRSLERVAPPQLAQEQITELLSFETPAL